ncbi:MAG: GTPase ObgE, partial [Myxococcales bacterium]|nr:GTPase ObgE [Myxococcales bacterium]
MGHAEMQFVDEISLDVSAGRGGDGCAAMRREKYRPLGGPAGGDGGKGGDVVFEADERLTTLMDLKYRRILKANNGEPGRGRDQYGKGGDDLVVRVPVGCQVFDASSGALLHDLRRPGQREVLASGGRGGRGNIHFKTSTERAPNRAEPGMPGEQRSVRVELKMLADVGLVGFPNAGKSTLIAAVSKARPKVADYPFTTLVPNLGVVSRGDYRSFVMADIPGIIEGAADGAGLGHRFLKHVERTRVLVFLLSPDPDPARDPLRDYAALDRELSRFDPELSARPRVIAAAKQDLPAAREALSDLQQADVFRGQTIVPFSAATGEGVEHLLDAIERVLAAHP